MKTLTLKLLFVSLCFLSIGTASCNAQWWTAEKGNGNVISEEREIGNFSAIRASNGLNVYLKQGDKESLKIRTDENLMDNIVTHVKGNVLILKVSESIKRPTKLDVYVTLVDINKLNISSGADVFSDEDLYLENIDITVSSGADAKLNLTAKSVSCSVSSGADAVLMGTTDYFSGSASSGSDLKAKELKAKECKAKASSGGDVSVYASESITAKASSGGDVDYYGEPTKINVSSSSGGDVNRR